MRDNLILRNKFRTLFICLGLLLIGGLLYVFHGHLDRETLLALSETIPAPLTIAAFLVLPLLGVSFRILLILVGFRFGFLWGGLVAGAGILAHNVAVYYLTRTTFRAHVRAFLKQKGHAIPSLPERKPPF